MIFSGRHCRGSRRACAWGCAIVGASICAVGALCAVTWYSGGTVFTLLGKPVPIFAGGEGLCLAGDRKINRETVKLRRFRSGDEFAVSDVICTTLAISNRKNYSPRFIEKNIRSHSPAAIAAAVCFGIVSYGHFYRGRIGFGWVFAILMVAQFVLAMTNYILSKKIDKSEFVHER